MDYLGDERQRDDLRPDGGQPRVFGVEGSYSAYRVFLGEKKAASGSSPWAAVRQTVVTVKGHLRESIVRAGKWLTRCQSLRRRQWQA